MTKPTKWHVRPVKTQISLGIRPVWSESSQCAQWVAKDPSFLHADSKDSDQTGLMPRLIWVFAGRTCHFVGFAMRWLIKVLIEQEIKWVYTDNKGICSSILHINTLKSHISLMDFPFPSLSIGRVHLSFKRCLVCFFHFYHIFDRNSCEQTVQTLIRRRVLRRLIWVCTDCLCPKNMTPCLYGLFL